tara:strand:- start:356 stop:502 length:147 start_codon:yes stop_codon:yes gene_type:complete
LKILFNSTNTIKDKINKKMLKILKFKKEKKIINNKKNEVTTLLFISVI